MTSFQRYQYFDRHDSYSAPCHNPLSFLVEHVRHIQIHDQNEKAGLSQADVFLTARSSARITSAVVFSLPIDQLTTRREYKSNLFPNVNRLGLMSSAD